MATEIDDLRTSDLEGFFLAGLTGVGSCWEQAKYYGTGGEVQLGGEGTGGGRFWPRVQLGGLGEGLEASRVVS